MVGTIQRTKISVIKDLDSEVDKKCVLVPMIIAMDQRRLKHPLSQLVYQR